MATMIPISSSDSDFYNSNSEKKIYNALWKNLPEDFIVLYSVNWRATDHKKREKVGEADFLIFHPHHGFLSIEAKGGGIERTIEGEWWSTDSDGERHRLKRSPMEQAWDSAKSFNAKIQDSRNPKAKQYTVKPVVWFTNLRSSSMQTAYGGDFIPGNTFNLGDLRDPLSALQRAYQNYDMSERNIDLSPADIRAIVSIFSREFNISSQVAITEAERNKIIFNRLTDEQTKVLDFSDTMPRARIDGVGGTGKTMVALERARRIPHDENVLFLCFNKFLLDTLRKNHAEEMPNVTFLNLNEMRTMKTGADEFASKAEIIEFLQNFFQYGFEFKHIIIDEGQDMEREYLDELLKIANRLDGYFYIFYDENQLVHSWDQKNLEWFENCGIPKLHLSTNCRNTMSVATTAYKPVGIENIKLAKDAVGTKPIMQITDTDAKIPELISQTIRNYTDKGYTKKQIVILTAKTLAKSVLAGANSVKGYRLSVDDPDGNNILFTTARKYKGLEADAVIIIDIDANSFRDANSRSVFYVAATRAVNELTLIANLDEEGMSKLLSDLEIEQSGSPRRRLEEALAVKITRT